MCVHVPSTQQTSAEFKTNLSLAGDANSPFRAVEAHGKVKHDL